MDRLVAATCAVMMIAVPTCLAQNGTGAPGTSVQTQQPNPLSRPKLLVLKNGRVVRGTITPRPGGYDIRKPVGTLFIGSTTVRFEATDMADAYQKMRSTFNHLTPETHIEIAQWCITNQQVAAARVELLDALHLEPSNEKARRMLQRLEAAAVPQRKKAETRTLAQRRMDQLLKTDHESLGGLTDKQAATFVSRVQPILERRCGNSSCHGSSSETEFVLTRSRGRSSRLVSERNLAVVLKQINFRNASDSPLLRVLSEPHTRDGRPVMPGRSGTVQKNIILDWVNSVVTKDGTKPSLPGGVRPPSKPEVPDSTKTAQSISATRALTESEIKTVKELRKSNEEDPFDPAEFNRKHHGFQSKR